jgi:hypothetical protein
MVVDRITAPTILLDVWEGAVGRGDVGPVPGPWCTFLDPATKDLDLFFFKCMS